jgi:UDP-N-acetylglucosamine 1-carboxyvinyltransferase
VKAKHLKTYFMPNFRITGGKPLSGTVHTGYSKNAVLPIFCAALLSSEPTTLYNVPHIEEVLRFEEIFNSIGIGFNWQDKHTVIITPPSNYKFGDVHKEAAIKTRSILYLLGALAPQNPNIQIPHSGGCLLGKRSVNAHFLALEKLGIKVEQAESIISTSHQDVTKTRNIIMYESGDTATNNAILAAVQTTGKTTIKMASANYMVQDLCFMLIKMGAKIEGVGTTTLSIEGVENFKGISYHVMNDPIESMFWIALAATTKSSITITDCPKEFVELELYKMECMNFKYTITKEHLSEDGNFTLIDITTQPSELLALPDKIYARPFPGMNIDNLPYFVPICLAAKGRSLIFDWCYENRAIYFMELQKLGANILLADPHRVVIEGPTVFRPNEIICPPALRPATMILCAMIAAKGTSIIRNTYPIDRGHEDLYQRLQSIGADIELVE